MADNVVEKWLEIPAVKNDFHIHATSTTATPATADPEKTPGSSSSSSNSSSTALKTKNAKQISSILSGLYRKKSPSEWEWLRINHSEWWKKRVELENIVDGHFFAGEPKTAQEPFYRLVEHLKTAPIDKLRSRIAKQLDNLSGEPVIDRTKRVNGRKFFGLQPIDKDKQSRCAKQ